jgi:TonB family protein
MKAKIKSITVILFSVAFLVTISIVEKNGFCQNQITKPDSISSELKIDSVNVFLITEYEPLFLNGGVSNFIAYVSKKMPSKLRKEIDNSAHIRFIVNCFGIVNDVELQKSSGSSQFDQEAIRIIQDSPKWMPAKQNGVAVNFQYVVPIQ